MPARVAALLCCVCLVGGTMASGQALPTSATIESIPLDPTMPDRFQVTAVLEPVRQVSIVAPSDGIVRGLEAPLGTLVRSAQEIAQLDRAEAQARLKIALAEVKEKEALLASQNSGPIAAAQLEAARGRAELAQIALDRLTLRAPFAGRMVALPVCSGQYVLKGTVIAELADLSSLKALVPVDRRAVKEGGDLRVYVEEQELTARVQSVLPLPEAYHALRDLAAPFAAAWVTVPNPRSELTAGLRIRSAALPTTPVATVPREAVKAADPAGGASASSALIQVIRSEYVTNVQVRVLGSVGADRLQVTGPVRPTDALIVSSSVPLLPGTLVRFSQAPASGVEGTTPRPDRRGAAAGIVAPAAPAEAPRPAAGSGRAPRLPSPPRGQNEAPF